MMNAAVVQEAEPTDEHLGDKVFVEGWTNEYGIPKFFTVQDRDVSGDTVEITVQNRDDLDEVYRFRVVDDTETVEYRALADDWQVLDSHLILDDHYWARIAWAAQRHDREAHIPYSGMADEIMAVEPETDLVLFERTSATTTTKQRWQFCDVCDGDDPENLRGPSADDEDVRAVLVGHAKGGRKGWYGFAEKLVVFEDHPAVTYIKRYPKDPYARPKRVAGFGGTRDVEYPTGYEPEEA